MAKKFKHPSEKELLTCFALTREIEKKKERRRKLSREIRELEAAQKSLVKERKEYV